MRLLENGSSLPFPKDGKGKFVLNASSLNSLRTAARPDRSAMALVPGHNLGIQLSVSETLGVYTLNGREAKLPENYGSITNESLDAVTSGMTPQAGDTIVAINGAAGCVPFALSVWGPDHITAVDTSSKALEDTRKQVTLLEAGQDNLFLSRGLFLPGHYDRTAAHLAASRAEYFSMPYIHSNNNIAPERVSRSRIGISRLAILKQTLANIDFRQQNILDTLAEGGFNKVYLSNAIGWGQQEQAFADSIFKALEEHLPQDGLFYAANGNDVMRYLKTSEESGVIETGTFVVDESRTIRAQSYQKASVALGGFPWIPVVFRKARTVS